MTTPYALPSLTLVTPLSIGSGGTGQSTATGTGIPVLQTSGTINSPLLQSVSITGAFRIFGGNTITTSTGDTSYAQFVLSGAPTIQSGVIIQANNNNGTFNNSAQLLLQANGNNATDVVFGQISGSGGDGSSYTIGRGTGAEAALTISSSFSSYNSLTIDTANGNTFLNQTNLYIDAGATQIIQLNSTAATFSIPIIVSGLNASSPVFTNSSKQLVSVTSTGSGAVVLSSSPSITTSLNLFTHNITSVSGTGASLLTDISPSIQDSLIIYGNGIGSNDATLSLQANGLSNRAVLNFSENQLNTTYYLERVGIPNGGLYLSSSINSTNSVLFDSENNIITITYPTISNTANNAVFNTGTSLNPGALSTNGGADLFQYSTGTFLPTVNWVYHAVDPVVGITYQSQEGSYIKIGRQVTVFYEVVCSFPGTGNDFLVSGIAFLAISGLPFPMSNINTSLAVNSKMATASFPNGIIPVANIPTIGAAVFPYGYDTILYEQGTVVPMNTWEIGYFSQGTWIADGITALVYCQAAVYGVAVDVPPYVNLISAYAQVYNLNVLASVSSYTNVHFSGSFTYTTNS